MNLSARLNFYGMVSNSTPRGTGVNVALKCGFWTGSFVPPLRSILIYAILEKILLWFSRPVSILNRDGGVTME